MVISSNRNQVRLEATKTTEPSIKRDLGLVCPFGLFTFTSYQNPVCVLWTVMVPWCTHSQKIT